MDRDTGTRDRSMDEVELLQELRLEMRSTRESLVRMEGKVEALASALGKAQENAQQIAVLQSEISNLKASQALQRSTTMAILALVVPTILAVISLFAQYK